MVSQVVHVTGLTIKFGGLAAVQSHNIFDIIEEFWTSSLNTSNIP